MNWLLYWYQYIGYIRQFYNIGLSVSVHDNVGDIPIFPFFKINYIVNGKKWTLDVKC